MSDETKPLQRFIVGRHYTGREWFTVMAATPEEAVQRLEDEGPETGHVSERDGDEYEAILDHVVYVGDTKVLDTATETTALSTPDSPADITVTLQISGNTLVRILSAAQARASQHPEANAELLDRIEQTRDELARRCRTFEERVQQSPAAR